MDLKCLLLCSDDKIVRVLRRTLGDLEISVQHCTSSEVALRHLTRERFEAIIVDCAGPGAAAVLRSARMAPCNKRAVAVAILYHGVGLRSAFELGAHFILYKPVSVERARDVLAKFQGLELVDDPSSKKYPTPLLAAGKNNCQVGRLRSDSALDNGLAFWVCGDQLLKGAALNALQIAETLGK